jgi:hypothetical protein
MDRSFEFSGHGNEIRDREKIKAAFLRLYTNRSPYPSKSLTLEIFLLGIVRLLRYQQYHKTATVEVLNFQSKFKFRRAKADQ